MRDQFGLAKAVAARSDQAVDAVTGKLADSLPRVKARRRITRRSPPDSD